MSRKPSPIRPGAFAAAVAAVLTLAAPGAAHAQKKIVAPSAGAPAVSIPAVPTVPAEPAFADELAGRRLLYAAREAYHNAPAVRFNATWRGVVQSRGARRGIEAAASGSETLAAEPVKMRLSLETEEGGTLRRAVANGTSMVATKVTRAADPKAKPAREFARLPFAEVGSLADALALVKLSPRTEAAKMALAPEWGLRGSAWRVPGLPATVVETEPVRQNGRARVTTTRRYKLDPNTRLLLSFEEWTVAEDRQARDGQRPRITYRREDYRAPQAGALSLPSSLYAQALPPGYVEVALPGSEEDLPPSVAPAQADPKALALLRRWQQAQDRLLTYSARVTVAMQAQSRTAESVPIPEEWRSRGAVYEVSLRRPGHALLTVTPRANPATAARPAANQRRGRGGFDRDMDRASVAAADGESVTVFDPRDPSRARTVELGGDPAALYGRLRQAGFTDPYEALTWLLARPSSLFGGADRAVYKGKATLENGEPVEVVEVTQVETPGEARDERGRFRRRGRGGRGGGGNTEVTTVATFYLGADGLPRRIDRFRRTDSTNRLERDEPPNLLVVARYTDVAVDQEIGRGVFTDAVPARAAAR